MKRVLYDRRQECPGCCYNGMYPTMRCALEPKDVCKTVPQNHTQKPRPPKSG